jgi:transcriptional regulator with XRE-family HTH domain
VQRGFVPEALRKARVARGMSVPDLSRFAGVSQGSLRRWEDGTGLPQVNSLRRVATALGVPISRLVKVPERKRMLSDLRVMAGLTQPEAAKAAGIATYTYALVERGLRELDDITAERLAVSLGVSGGEVCSAWQRARDRPPGTPA